MNSASHSAAARNASPLIGRARERRIINDALTVARAGQGRLILIGGEAGIGKSALAEATCRAAGDALVLSGHSYELSETPPYGPWVELFARYRPQAGQPTLPEAFALEGAIGDVSSRAALFRDVRAFFAALASPHQVNSTLVVILLEDLHWSDPASLDLLRFLARELTDAPVLLVATYRRDEITPDHMLAQLMPALIRESRGVHLELQRLERADIHTLITRRYRLPDSDLKRLSDYLFQRAEGNPFFTFEVIHTLEESRVLRETDDGWQVGELSRVPVPALVRQVIEGRLARLDHQRRNHLALAAVIGQELSLDLWASVAEVESDALLQTVERAIAGHLLEETHAGNSIRFVHALIRETLFERAPLPMRQTWHRRAAEVLMARPNPDPDVVAGHFQRAGDPRAVEWLIRAGERSQRALAWTTAIRRYQAAVDLLDGSETDVERQVVLLCRMGMLHRFTDPRQGVIYMERATSLAQRSADPVLRGMSQYYLGVLHGFSGDGIQTIENNRAGLSVLDTLDTTGRERFRAMMLGGRMGNDHNPWASYCVGLVIFGHYREAEQRIERLIADEAALEEHARARNATAYRALIDVHAAFGRPEQARAAAARARDYFQALGHHAMVVNTAAFELRRVVLAYQADQLAERERLAALAERAWSLAADSFVGADFSPRSSRLPLLILEGEWTEASLLGPALINLPWMFDIFGGQVAELARWRGDPAYAWQVIYEVMSDGPLTAPGKVHFQFGLELQRVAAALTLDGGDLATSASWLEAHDRWLAWSAVVAGRAEGHLAWADWHQASNDLERAAKRASAALACATNPRQPLALIGAHRLRGTLETKLGNHPTAANHLSEALALATACVAPYERARTSYALARLARAQGNNDQAIAHATEAGDICTRLGAQLLLARIIALQAEIDTAADVARPRGITRRELEVLRLAAQGLDNAAIAERLFISAHTVHRHMANILTKLDVANRAAAVAWALRADLL